MILALAIAVSSIAIGAVLGLLPGSARRSGGPFQTFAMVMAVAVVLGQLLPEALAELGVAALAAFGAGFALPRLAEKLAVALSKPACLHDNAMCTDLGLELGYVGLLLHHVGDGIGLGLYAGPLHANHGHYDVLAALAGHTIPLTALVVLAFRTHRGPVDAALRAVGIALATMLGVALASMLSPAQLTVWEPWLTAFVGGLLLHVVAHGWPAESAPTRASRLMDFAALAAGIAMLSLGGHSHAAEHHGGADVLHGGTASALLELTLETAPMLLLGLLVAALLQTRGARLPTRLLRGRGPLRDAIGGALIGAPLPLCACGVLPVAHSLRARGGAAALVVAFLLSTPELGVETFALSVKFLGWPFAYLRLAGGVLVAIVAAWVVGRMVRSAPEPHNGRDASAAMELGAAHGERGVVRQVFANFDELLYHVGAWTLIGLLAAAYLQAALLDGSLGSLGKSGFDVLLVTVLAVPSYVCAASATPLAAVLLAKGMSPGAVLCGLLLGPATNVATLAWLRRTFGARATLFGVAALLATTWSLAWVANVLLPAPITSARAGVEHTHGVFGYVCAGLLVALVVRAIWRTGLRTWLGALGETFSIGAHDHGAAHAGAHGHDHGPAHRHDHDHQHEHAKHAHPHAAP